MPTMYCARFGVSRQCEHKTIAIANGTLPIIKFEYKTKASDKICKDLVLMYQKVQIDDFIYKSLKEKHENPTQEEYDEIIGLISLVYNRVPSEKKHRVLKIVESYFWTKDIRLSVCMGLVLKDSFDYIYFHDHTYRSIGFRRRAIS